MATTVISTRGMQLGMTRVMGALRTLGFPATTRQIGEQAALQAKHRVSAYGNSWAIPYLKGLVSMGLVRQLNGSKAYRYELVGATGMAHGYALKVAEGQLTLIKGESVESIALTATDRENLDALATLQGVSAVQVVHRLIETEVRRFTGQYEKESAA